MKTRFGNRSKRFLRCIRRFEKSDGDAERSQEGLHSDLRSPLSELESISSPISEIFGVGDGIAEIVVDEYCGLAGEFEAFAAFVASNEVVQPNHVGRGVVEFLAVFRAGAARKLLFLAADFPADGKLEIFVAAWTNKLRLPDFLFFRVERALVHG